jgi:hypothetical protein
MATTIEPTGSVVQGFKDRLGYALIGAFFGALVGLLGWWVYGFAHTLRYRGPGIDPLLRQWIVLGSVIFAALGFILRERAADVVAGALSAVLGSEPTSVSARVGSAVLRGVVLVIVVALIWMLNQNKG